MAGTNLNVTVLFKLRFKQNGHSARIKREQKLSELNPSSLGKTDLPKL